MKALALVAKILAGIVLVFALIFLGLYLFVKNAAPTALANFVQSKSGFKLAWDKFDLQTARGRVELKNFKIQNPESFETQLFLTLPSVIVDADLSSLKQQPYRMEDLTLHLSELNVVTNKNGQSNIELLQTAFTDPKEKAKADIEASSGKQQEPTEIFFKHIKLQVDTVKLINYTQTPAKETSIALNFSFERQNLTSTQLQSELQAALMPIVLKNIGPAALQESFGTALGGLGIATDAFGKGFKASSQVAGQGVDAAKAGAQKTAEELKSTLNSFKGIFKKE